MALPKLFQKLFANDGVGPLLRSDILPIQTVDGYAPDASGNITTERLPLSGGTMTGELKLADGLAIVGTNDSSIHAFMGGSSYAGGAYFQAIGKDSSVGAGWFNVVARGANSSKTLNGKPDGVLSWDGKHIVRSVNGVAADVAGNVALKAVITETWRNGLLWYRKWSDGWVEQGNTMDYGDLVTVNFPVAFRDIDYTFITSARANNDNAGTISCSERREQRTATTASVTCRWNGYGNTGVQFSWYACGYC